MNLCYQQEVSPNNPATLLVVLRAPNSGADSMDAGLVPGESIIDKRVSCGRDGIEKAQGA